MGRSSQISKCCHHSRLILELLEGKITHQLPGGNYWTWGCDMMKLPITDKNCCSKTWSQKVFIEIFFCHIHALCLVILVWSFNFLVSFFNGPPLGTPGFSGRIDDNFIEARVPRFRCNFPPPPPRWRPGFVKQWPSFSPVRYLVLPVRRGIHPGGWTAGTWEYGPPSKRRIIFQTFIFGFYVNLWGCISTHRKSIHDMYICVLF